ncbi:MAG TPA: PAS domain S-box protein, partial [Candidatus Kryptobacter bacterium]|nr:PAS domain S-box protein [Candidatus Kryptobacter bacterium]
GGIRQAQFMLYDVTDRRMAENALKESEQKFRVLAESASSSIFMYQKNKICYVNAACSALTGYDPEELLKMDFWEVVHPDFRELAKELGLARQRGEPVPNHFELKLRTKSGEGRWVDFTGTTTKYQGELAVLGTVYDVTERKNANTKLEESEEQHRLLVDKSPDAIMVVTDGKLAYLNPAALKLLQAESPDKLLGKPLVEIFHPDSRKRFGDAINDIRKTLRSMELENEKFLRPDGSTYAVDVVAAPVTYEGMPSVQLVARDMSSHLNVREQLRLQSVALNTAANAIVLTDKEGIVVWANPAFETLTGYSVSEAVGRNIGELSKSDKQDEAFFKDLWDTILSGNVWHGEVVNRRKNGTPYTEDLTIAPVKDDGGAVTHLVAIMQDVTMRKSFEGKVLQAQKLEGIAQLAGGVAHDYNNILGVILGYGELLKRKLNAKDPARIPVDAILTATRRGADPTKQLLAFAQKGLISPRVVDVNKAIEGMEGVLQRIVGDHLKLDIFPLKGLWNVKIDPTHLDQMLVNLASNARDAITGDSGMVEIKTSNVVADEPFVRKHVGFTPGEYVMITFSDTGRGMDRKTQERIFEPFFTTKPNGSASGLGLATVYGIVKRNNGAITVRSAPGEGTTFCIYLPRFDKAEPEPTEEAISLEPLQSNETVLLVEDQADLLELVKENLEEYGYKVMTALEAEEALVFCEAYPEKIDILVTDVIMPGMSGKELSEKVMRLRPGIKTLFMSGYSANALAPEGILGNGIEFLQKPFTAYELAKKVHQVLYP